MIVVDSSQSSSWESRSNSSVSSDARVLADSLRGNAVLQQLTLHSRALPVQALDLGWDGVTSADNVELAMSNIKSSGLDAEPVPTTAAFGMYGSCAGHSSAPQLMGSRLVIAGSSANDESKTCSVFTASKPTRAASKDMKNDATCVRLTRIESRRLALFSKLFANARQGRN